MPLGTDGMGRSDTREALRRHFETDTGHVVVGVLSALAADGSVDIADVEKAVAHYGIDPDLPDPRDPLAFRPSVASDGATASVAGDRSYGW